MFGTMCKPLHAGKAAYHGLLAARLAARGFTSRSDVLECGQGFARTHSPDFHPERALETPASGWHIRNNLFKYHAACYMTHAAIEAARKVHDQAAPIDQIARIRLALEEANDRICNIPAPRTGLEAKFSLKLTTAMGLAGYDTGRLATFSEEVAANPVLVGLRDKVELDFRTGVSSTFSAIEVELTDGRRFTAQHDAGVPAADTMEQGRRLAAKFEGLVEPLLGANRSRSLIETVQSLDTQPDITGLAPGAGR